MFDVESLDEEIEGYLQENWEQVVADIDALVRIPSVEDLQAAAPGAPWGPAPAQALSAALSIAGRMGFDSRDCDGYIGYADLAGESAKQIAVIGHVDVVPAGPGWNFPPYEVTRKDGYLVGRGVSDDKGPLVVALHAAAFWRERLIRRGERLPYALRIIFGANEETGMGDVPYYRRHFPDPAFLFTPDADFPVGYGEAGICHGRLVSAPIEGGSIRALAGGVANNAVPGEAFARLACPVDALPKAGDGVQVESDGGSAVVRAYGKSAHASEPESGDNAIDKLAAFLLGVDVLSGEERAFLETVRKITAHTDGSGAGLQCSDDHFGGLTAVGSMIALEQAENGEGADRVRMALTIDCRYPTTTSAEGIARIMNEAAAESGATYELLLDKPSYLVDPDSPAIRALVQAYCHATGEDARPVALKGGTYAREFPCAASFGPDKPWESLPAWAGGMHAADEAISEDALKQAFAIYVHAIGNLMQLDL